MQEIDWEKIWMERFDERKILERKASGIECWDQGAESFSESRKVNDYEYGRKVMDTLREVIDSNSEVLEIGAGPGTFVIPFARKVKKVTAVEPSKGMVEYLRRNAEEAGIANFELITRKWEDVDVTKIAGKFDMVISSIVAWMFRDIGDYLMRMEKVSKGYCCIVGSSPGDYNGVYKELWRKVLGEDYKRPPRVDYKIIYNLLCERGRFVNVKVINCPWQTSVDYAINSKVRGFGQYKEVTEDDREIIRHCILKHSKNGIYSPEENSAVMWWKAPDRGDE